MSRSVKVLFIIGSKNQTQIMHKVSQHLPSNYECYFSTFYGDGWLKRWEKRGWLEATIMGKWCQKENADYCQKHGLEYDYRGEQHDYDLVFMTTDMVIPSNIKKCKKILIQEGIIEPVDWRFNTAKLLGLPRVLADTAMLGLSDDYTHFCVFSEGYKKEFIKRGVKPNKIMVTSVPNFDNVDRYRKNDFPHKDFVLVPTSNHRETARPHDRVAFIKKVLKIAGDRQIIFKLHPREIVDRATKEIEEHAPGSLVYATGNTEEMVANCSCLIATYSTVVLTAAALGKEIYSDYPKELLNELKPLQNGGKSAKTIATLGVELIEN